MTKLRVYNVRDPQDFTDLVASIRSPQEDAPMAKKQKELPGMERKSIPEIETAAEAYVEARDERMARTEDEVSARDALIEVMNRHKLKVYKDEGSDPPLVITLEDTTVTVKVKKVPREPDYEADKRDHPEEYSSDKLGKPAAKPKKKGAGITW